VGKREGAFVGEREVASVGVAEVVEDGKCVGFVGDDDTDDTGDVTGADADAEVVGYKMIVCCRYL